MKEHAKGAGAAPATAAPREDGAIRVLVDKEDLNAARNEGNARLAEDVAIRTRFKPVGLEAAEFLSSMHSWFSLGRIAEKASEPEVRLHAEEKLGSAVEGALACCNPEAVMQITIVSRAAARKGIDFAAREGMWEYVGMIGGSSGCEVGEYAMHAAARAGKDELAQQLRENWGLA
jgi:hypothetical protein